MEWVDLVTPALAVLGVFLGLALIVQSIRHSRAIRRLEEQLKTSGHAATEMPLQRLKELQQRVTTSQGGLGANRRTLLIGLGVLIGAAAIAGGAWAMFLRDGGTETTPTGGTQTGTTRTTAQPPPDPTLCPRRIPPLDDNSLTTVQIFNASGVAGAAREKIRPLLDLKGYDVPPAADSPDGRTDLTRSAVQFVTRQDRNAACNVARDLEIRPIRVTQLDGLTEDQIGGSEVNVVVLVGTDLANR